MSIVFYHYTDGAGKNAIENSKKIIASGGRGDAAFGPGVYGTEMDPATNSKIEIAENNYDGQKGFWEKLLGIGRVNFVIKVTLPRNKVRKIRKSSRDILVHEGDMDISQYSYEIIKV